MAPLFPGGGGGGRMGVGLERWPRRGVWDAGAVRQMLLGIGVMVLSQLVRADRGAEGSRSFRVAFLQEELEFQLTADFSADAVAMRFCAEHGFDTTHVRAVRELVENAVHEALGADRIAAGMQGEDSEARWFVESVCRDFPRLHRLNQLFEGQITTHVLKTLAVRSEPRRVIDAVPFFNELEMLRVRFEELDPVVDKFVLVESAMTHSGKPKPLHFEDNRSRFEPWLDKIVHVVMETLPDSLDHWVRERSQRDGIHEGVAQTGALPEDLLLVSDTDEIPRRSTVRAMSWCDGLSTPAQLRSAFYYYSLQYRWQFFTAGHPPVLEPFQWKQPRAALVGELLYPRLTVNHLRYDPGEHNMEEINDGAWHLSFFGGEDRVRVKLEAYAHQEHNTPDVTNLEHIRSAMAKGADLFGRGAVHGELMNCTEPYDLPAAILADAATGAQTFALWLPHAFDVSAYRGSGLLQSSRVGFREKNEL